jgi:hypothetical protein
VSPNFPPPGHPQYGQESPPFAPVSPNFPPPGHPPFAPGSPQYGKGFANVFNNEMMNAYFNKLPGDKQSTILQMPKEQQEIVMRTIMAKSARQNDSQGQQGQQGGSGLTDMFKRLPVKYQVDALGSQYKTIASAFNKLGGDIDAPKITIINNKYTDPIGELRDSLHLEPYEQNDGSPSVDTSSDSNDITSSNEGTTKTINIT